MRTISASAYERIIDQEVINKLETLLATKFQNIDDFLALPDNERYFGHLVASGDYSRLGVGIDHKWTPEDLIWSIQNALPELPVKIIKDEWVDDWTFDLTLETGGEQHQLSVDFDNPSGFVDFINEHLLEQRFIELDYQDDSFSWVLVPANLNITELCGLLGFTEEMNQPTPAPDFENYIDPNKQLAHKLFFNLHIYSQKNNDPNGETLYLAFHKDGKQNYYASRVMPSQTLNDAVSEELRDHFGTHPGDWIFVRGNTYADTTKDKKGRDIERVDVYVLIPYFDPGLYVLAGMNMAWIPTQEKESDNTEK